MAGYEVDRTQQSSQRVSRAAGVLLLAFGYAALVHCGAVDDRQVDILDGGPRPFVPPEQTSDPLRPGPEVEGTAPESQANGAAGRGESPINPTAPGAAGAAGPSGGSAGGTGGGVCAAVDDDPSCTAATSREGACVEAGVCVEYCTVGPSRLGQCLVKPG